MTRSLPPVPQDIYDAYQREQRRPIVGYQLREALGADVAAQSFPHTGGYPHAAGPHQGGQRIDLLAVEPGHYLRDALAEGGRRGGGGA